MLLVTSPHPRTNDTSTPNVEDVVEAFVRGGISDLLLSAGAYEWIAQKAADEIPRLDKRWVKLFLKLLGPWIERKLRNKGSTLIEGHYRALLDRVAKSPTGILFLGWLSKLAEELQRSQLAQDQVRALISGKTDDFDPDLLDKLPNDIALEIATLHKVAGLEEDLRGIEAHLEGLANPQPMFVSLRPGGHADRISRYVYRERRTALVGRDLELDQLGIVEVHRELMTAEQR